jgi:hypothetical protein
MIEGGPPDFEGENKVERQGRVTRKIVSLVRFEGVEKWGEVESPRYSFEEIPVYSIEERKNPFKNLPG